MARIQPNKTPDAKATQLLDAVKKKLGGTPNVFTTLSHSAAALEGYLNFSGALDQGVLPAKLRKKIALAVAGVNGCNYCASAHSALGKGMGLTESELGQSIAVKSEDAKTQAALTFVKQIIEAQGKVSDKDFDAVRSAGFNDTEIAEIVANIALSMFTNYFNNAVGTAIDFPVVSTDSAKKVA